MFDQRWVGVGVVRIDVEAKLFLPAELRPFATIRCRSIVPQPPGIGNKRGRTETLFTQRLEHLYASYRPRGVHLCKEQRKGRFPRAVRPHNPEEHGGPPLDRTVLIQGLRGASNAVGQNTALKRPARVPPSVRCSQTVEAFWNGEQRIVAHAASLLARTKAAISGREHEEASSRYNTT